MNTAHEYYLPGKEIGHSILAELQQNESEIFSDQRARFVSYFEEIPSFLQGFFDRNPEFKRLLTEALRFNVLSARYEFLNHIEYAALLAAKRTLNVEHAFFGQNTPEAAEIGFLLSVFTNVLDGILDEVPEIVSPEDKKELGRVMVEQEWATSRVAPEIISHPDRHPIVCLLMESMRLVLLHLIETQGWRSDEKIRREFSEATRYAFHSEKKSTKLKLGHYWPDDMKATEKMLFDKSVAPAKIGLLIPICFHGWPKELSPQDLDQLAWQLGSTGGWLDDICDIHDDLESGVWSNVLLELYRIVHKQAPDPERALMMLQWSLSDRVMQRYLIRASVERFERLMTYIEALPIPNKLSLKQSIADKAMIFLSGFDFNAFESWGRAIPVKNQTINSAVKNN